MKPEEWFRRTEWNSDIEAGFETRLRRSRTAFNRAQYLRIQGLTLIQTNSPDLIRAGMHLTHRVLAEYGEIKTEISLCLHTLGKAHQQLGEFDEALAFYRKAWEFERGFPKVFTGACGDLALLIVRLKRMADAEEALAALDARPSAADDMFPRVVMHRSLVHASIAEWRGDPAAAAAYARQGLAAASKTRSPLHSHPTLALVSAADAADVQELERLAHLSSPTPVRPRRTAARWGWLRAMGGD